MKSDGEQGDPQASRSLHPGAREVYRDDVLWVLDKPAGVLSHPNAAHGKGSNALFRAAYDLEREVYDLGTGGGERREVFLVHRLDQETSGILLCTFDAEAAAKLKEALFHRDVTKEYRALVLGAPPRPEGEWRDRLEKGTAGGRATVKVMRGPANSVTRYAVVEALRPQGLSLLALWPETGRTHQLRVQAASRGHPIAGDERYGDFLANRYLALEAGLKRMFLHAQRVELRHPVTGHKLRLEARLPRKLVESLEKARALERQIPRRR